MTPIPLTRLKTSQFPRRVYYEFLRRWLKDIIHAKYGKPADKIESKFEVGNWIIRNNTRDHTQFILGQVIDVNEYYRCCDQSGEIVNFSVYNAHNNFHLWSIEDANPGDVLAHGNLPFIFKKIDTNKYSYAYCGISVYGDFKIESDGESGEWTWMQDIKPAAKEQRETLEKAMTDAGFTFDYVNKELKKIENVVCREEDVHWSQKTIDFIKHPDLIKATPALATNTIEWIKSLRNRVQPQPKQEWSEEDKRNLQGIIDEIEANKHNAPDYDIETYDRFISWLESLRNQNT